MKNRPAITYFNKSYTLGVLGSQNRKIHPLISRSLPHRMRLDLFTKIKSKGKPFNDCTFFLCIFHLLAACVCFRRLFSSSIWFAGLLGWRNVEGQTKFVPKAECFRLKYPTNQCGFNHIKFQVTYKKILIY